MLLSIILAAVAAAPSSAPTSQRPWKASDFSAITFIDDVQISPSGTAVLIDVGRPIFSTDEFSSGYRALALPSGASKMMPHDLAGPRWSPDGTSIAWIRCLSPTR